MSPLRASAALLLLGCGARSGPEGPLPETTPAPAVVPACVAGLAPEPAYLGPPGDACAMAPTLEGAGLVALADFTVWTARGNEATSVAELFEGAEEGGSTHHGVVLSRGAFSAVAAFAHHPDHAEARVELLLLRRTTGELLARKGWEMADESFGNELRLVGDARGLFAVGARLGDGIVTRIFDVAGGEHAGVEGVLPIGDPDAWGRVPVRDETDGAEHAASWLDPCSGDRTPVRAPSGHHLMALGDGLLAFDAEAPALVLETSESTRRLSLPADVTGLFTVSNNEKALLTTGSPTGFVVADLPTGTTARREITLPTGFVRYDALTGLEGFEASSKELVLTSSGGLALPLRNAEEGYVFVSEDGATWQPLGRPIGEVYRAYLGEAGGTLLHFGSDFAVTLPPWAPPQAGSQRIDGTSLQAIRPASGQRADFPASNTRYYQLTQDGGCLGVATEGQVMTLSLADGMLRNYVIGASTFGGVDAFAFATREGTTLLAQ